MDVIAIRSEAVGKQYRLGSGHPSHQYLRDAIVACASYPLRRIRGRCKGQQSQSPEDKVKASREAIEGQ